MVTELVWHEAAKELPPPDATVVATDGHARWFDSYRPRFGWLRCPHTLNSARPEPTHWHPVLDLPQTF